MSASTSVTTYNIPEFPSNVTYLASVVAADPTTTTLILYGPTAFDEVTLSIAFGSWAQITPPPQVDQAIWEMYWKPSYTRNPLRPIIFGEYCEVSSGAAVQCAITHPSGETSTLNSQDSSWDASYYSLRPVPLTITAGLEKLSSATTAPSDVVTTTPTSPTRAGISSAHESSATFAPSTGSNSSSNAASNALGTNVGTVGLLVLVASFFAR
ncbi:hypothetical protein K461DRAFT_295705 [Myriangium duriaei CBS 260.36]|uniref:Uncharacterized protein n=1 Tax=Myriangium duriaei CBS 260.36 TaxID=1168546 RepID=A0A9P4IZ17_9PEZI|nr:hypothetical protein K461DRAFT_295705 [Myriangium duriaei CBS 260.36]